MKVSKLKTNKVKALKPFYEDDNISLAFKHSGKITAIVARNGKKQKEFPIVKDDILSTFKKVEKFFSKI